MVALTSRTTAILRVLALLALLALAWVALRAVPVHAVLSPGGLDRVRGTLLGAWWGPVAFVAAYAVLSTLDFSGLVLTLVGGAVFGFWWGTLLNTVAANLGANGAFWLARVLGRDGLRSLFGGRLARLDHLAAHGGPMWLLRLRLIPVVPFNLLNLAAGVTAMPWPGYAVATAAGILPRTRGYTYFADALAAGASGSSQAAWVRVAVAGAILVALTFLPSMARRLHWVESRP